MYATPRFPELEVDDCEAADELVVEETTTEEEVGAT